MTLEWVRQNLPVEDDIIKWPEIIPGLAVQTEVDAFIRLFEDVPDDMAALKKADKERGTGFSDYLDAVEENPN